MGKQLRHFCRSMDRKLPEIKKETQVSEDLAGEAQQVAQEAKDAVHALYSRVTALEGRNQDQGNIKNKMEELQARCEALAAGAAGQVQELHDCAERLERASMAASLMIFGLPEAASQDPFRKWAAALSASRQTLQHQRSSAHQGWAGIMQISPGACAW